MGKSTIIYDNWPYFPLLFVNVHQGVNNHDFTATTGRRSRKPSSIHRSCKEKFQTGNMESSASSRGASLSLSTSASNTRLVLGQQKWAKNMGKKYGQMLLEKMENMENPPQKNMDLYGSSWIFMDLHWFSWIFMDQMENPLKNLWKHLEAEAGGSGGLASSLLAKQQLYPAV